MTLFLIDLISFELAERPDNSQKESTNLSCVWILPVHSVICVFCVVYTIQQLLKWGCIGRSGGSKIVQTVVIQRVQWSLFLHLGLLNVDLKCSSAQNVEMIILRTVECSKKINW